MTGGGILNSDEFFQADEIRCCRTAFKEKSKQFKEQKEAWERQEAAKEILNSNKPDSSLSTQELQH